MNDEAARRIAAATACAFLIAVFLLFVVRNWHRAPSPDEAEYLHTSLRMARGERIFTDFFQHHSPLFFAMLMPFAPDGNGVAAMQGFVLKARVFTLACAVVAMLAAALLVWRASGRLHAPIVVLAVVLSAGGLWTNGLGDIRAESPGLALWWSGAALVLLARRGGWRGVGLGLIFLANLVNPKWPVESVAVGVLFLVDAFRDRRAIVAAAATATLVAAAGAGAIALLTDLDLFYVNIVRLSVVLRDKLAGWDETGFVPFVSSPRLARPLAMIPAAALVVLAWLRVRHAFAAPKLVASLLVIAAAALVELRFFYMWPVLDFRWFAFWTFAAATVMALAPQSLAALLERWSGSARRLVRALPAALTAIAVAGSAEMIPVHRPERELFWQRSAWLESRLGPADTMWLDTWFHPIGARDSSYYWFGFADLLPYTLEFARTQPRFYPPLGETDLPPCRIERGLDRNTLFLQRPFPRTPAARACFDRLAARGAVVTTPIPKVWMVRR